MITAVVGFGGKTTLIKELAKQYVSQGKKVFVTTTTHMLIEEDTLLTDDANVIIAQLKTNGYAMAGVADGIKIKALSDDTYAKVCEYADVVLVEADGSKKMPLKYPNDTEPVIPDNVDEIVVVCCFDALGQKAKDVCHRLEYAKKHVGIDDQTVINPVHIQNIVDQGYLKPLSKKYPDKKISVYPRHNGTLYQRVLSSMLKENADLSAIREEWFCPQPHLFVCGAGHVAKEVASLAKHLDFEITVIDDRADLATEQRFPDVNQLICDSYDNLDKYLKEDAYYVVVTPDHKADLLCVRKILQTKYSYLGMIGSKKKVASTFENLSIEGFGQEQIDTIFAPIGLDIGAVTPSEIAISILAQIIQQKNKKHSASVDRELLQIEENGVLCIITQKQGSAPRGVGSMLFVGKDKVLGSIGGGEAEYFAICHARNCNSAESKQYALNRQSTNGLDMICGGTIQVTFVPV